MTQYPSSIYSKYLGFDKGFLLPKGFRVGKNSLLGREPNFGGLTEVPDEQLHFCLAYSNFIMDIKTSNGLLNRHGVGS